MTFTNLFAPFTGTRYLLCTREGDWEQFDTKDELLLNISGFDPLGVLELEQTSADWGGVYWHASDKIARAYVERHASEIEWDPDSDRWMVDPFFADAAIAVLGTRAPV